MTPDQAIERFYDPGSAGSLSTVAYGKGRIPPASSYLCSCASMTVADYDRFTARSLEVRNPNDPNTPENRADHPTNGPRRAEAGRRWRIALCKNHHWAMDRDIIAPGPDLHWHVSKLIDPRRSNGEKELAEIAGKSVLLPKDPAFHPEKEGLEWRANTLNA